MRDFSLPGYVVATLLEAAILAASLALVPATGRRRAVAFPAALVVAEAVRGGWPFGGLPVSGIDLGQVDGPLATAARLGGRLLLVAMVGLAGVGLAALARRRWRAGMATLATVAAVALAGTVAPDGRVDGRLAVAAVQGGGPRGLRAVLRDPGPVFERQLEASSHVRTPVDLVLWPEDVVDVDGPLAGSAEEGQVAALARSVQATVVAGVVEDVGVDRFRNAAVVWRADGTIGGRYDKVHRVPFGEYVPGRAVIGRVADLSAIPRDAVAGRGPGVLDTPGGRVGVLVSYEVFFPDRARDAARAGGRLLLVPTNASSYRDAQVPAQEVAVARLRALETGRWLVQAAPTGYSAVIDQRGRVRGRGGLGGPAVVAASVELRSGTTLAVRLGPRPWLIVALGMLALGKLERYRGRFVAERAAAG
jgi:apolipoprotein N-acyltransferase